MATYRRPGTYCQVQMTRYSWSGTDDQVHWLAISLSSLARYSSGVADSLGEEGRQASFYILLTTNTLLLLLQVRELPPHKIAALI